MIEQHSAAAIGRYGYTNYTGRLVDDQHTLALVPQSVADGWEAFCSCGEWRAFESFYAIANKDALLDALRTAHRSHVERAA